MKKTSLLLLILFFLAIIFPPTFAHSSSEDEVYVRVVNADPETKTYTFSCRMNPETTWERAWHIRPDSGTDEYIPDEVGDIRTAADEFFTYTFQENKFYHVGCLALNPENFSKSYRGDLHIDLRTDSWDPEIVPQHGEGKTGTYTCDYSKEGTPEWRVINARTGELTTLEPGNPLTHTVSGHGIYDYICRIDGHATGMPIEYFDQGEPYFPDQYGIPDGVFNVRNETSTPPSDPEEGDEENDQTTPPPEEEEQPDETETTPTTDTCYEQLKHLPVTCNGEITQDTTNGCRTITCENNTGTLQILACEKPDKGEKEYFEIYRQATSGTAPEICIGDTCIQNHGYKKSTNYPWCEQDTEESDQTTPPPEEEEQPDETETTPTTDTCYEQLKHLPVTCNGGSIINDVFDGCRTITCGGTNGELEVLACEKPDRGEKEYFEMYKRSESGTAPEICIGDTCIQNNGYAKSSNYPWCTQQTTTPPQKPDEETTPPSEGTVPLPEWIEPSQGLTNVPTDYFHLATVPPSNDAEVASSDWEVWMQSQRVWSAYSNTGFIKYHTHTPDGVFENQATQLEPLTTYQTRVRYRGVDGEVGPWSEWRSFTTQEQQITNPSSPDWTAASGYRVEKVAGDFDLPVHLAFAPNNYEHLPANQRPYFYVTELHGTIKTVYPDGSNTVYADDLLNFNPFGSITGAGQMGLVSLYVEPTTGDVYAGTVYLEGEDVYNKVLKFTTNQDGDSYTNVQTIIDGLPSGPSHQIQEITRGPDGKLYVNLGEGLVPSDAQKDDVLAGKIIRMNLDGSDVEIYAKGFRNPFGGDWRPGYNDLYVTDNAPDTGDRLVKVVQGENYGWGLNDNFATFKEKRIDTLNVSPVGLAFNPGHHAFNGELYVAVAGPIYQQGPVNGKHILEYTLDTHGEIASRRTFVEYTGSGYGTPIGLRFGTNGLYFTDIYGEPGFVGLGETEANIYRVVPGEPIDCPGCIGGEFRAGISILSWYPKDAGDGIEYIFECKGIDGSGSYSYAFDMGFGPYSVQENKQFVKYPYGDVDYAVSCIANDLVTGESSSASIVVNPNDFIAE